LQYLRSFGPGIIIVLTWLGAGDIVEMGVAGGNFGYALMWGLVLAITIRFLLISLIAKYQLCNQHNEGVLDGLARLHPWYPFFLVIAAVVMGHVYGSYMTVGVAEASMNLTGIGPVWHWALLWNGVAIAIVFRPLYGRIELVFKFFLVLLSISFFSL
jgi:Mn2+/Fe2+ NRAMP family transporter